MQKSGLLKYACNSTLLHTFKTNELQVYKLMKIKGMNSQWQASVDANGLLS